MSSYKILEEIDDPALIFSDNSSSEKKVGFFCQ